MEFEWDAIKALEKELKHEVSFAEASSCFWDSEQVSFFDPDHSDDEDREILIGHSRAGRLLLVVFTLRGSSIRIISARKATKKEGRAYAKGI